MSETKPSVIFLRTNPVSPDPRIEKEADALIEVGYNVSVFAWDREGGRHGIYSGYLGHCMKA